MGKLSNNKFKTYTGVGSPTQHHSNTKHLSENASQPKHHTAPSHRSAQELCVEELPHAAELEVHPTRDRLRRVAGKHKAVGHVAAQEPQEHDLAGRHVLHLKKREFS